MGGKVGDRDLVSCPDVAFFDDAETSARACGSNEPFDERRVTHAETEFEAWQA